MTQDGIMLRKEIYNKAGGVLYVSYVGKGI